MPKFSKTTKWTIDTTLICLTCLSLYMTVSSISESTTKESARPINMITTFFMLLLNLMDIKEFYDHKRLSSVNPQPSQAVTTITRSPSQNSAFWYPVIPTFTEGFYLGVAANSYWNQDSVISTGEGVVGILAVILPYVLKEFRLGFPSKRRDPLEDEDAFRTWLNKRRNNFADPSKLIDMAPGETKRSVLIEEIDNVTKEFDNTFHRSH